MKTETLIFLNARNVIDEQFVILNAARELGYRVIFFNHNCPQYLKNYIYQHIKPKLIEEEFIQQAIDLQKKYKVVGVFSFTDLDLEKAAKIAQALNVPCIKPENAYLARNKYSMRKQIYMCEKNLVPLFAEITSKTDIEHANITYPAVLKPISAGGSKGIFTVNNQKEAFLAFEELQNISNTHTDGELYKRYGEKFILEEFIEGQEFSVEGIVVNHVFYIAGITDKQTTKDWNLQYRHIFPANYEPSVLEEIKACSKKVVKYLGLNNCPIHLEAKWSKGQFKLIEVGARIGGGLISTHLVSKSLNINYIKEVIDSIVKNRTPNLTSPQSVNGIIYKLASKKQRFLGFTMKGDMYNIMGLSEIKEIVPRETEILLPPENFDLQRLGFIAIQGAKFEEVATNLELAIKKVNIL